MKTTKYKAPTWASPNLKDADLRLNQPKRELIDEIKRLTKERDNWLEQAKHNQAFNAELLEALKNAVDTLKVAKCAFADSNTIPQEIQDIIDPAEQAIAKAEGRNDK